MTMKRYAIIIILAIVASISGFAQKDRQEPMSEKDRQQWLEELRNYKHDFLVKDLGLTKDQQQAFFPLYDQMDDELNAISDEMKDMESKMYRDENVSDEDLQQAALLLFQQKGQEATVELSYFDKFKEILTPSQLFRLKNAERKFTQTLAKQRFKNAGPKHKQ